MLRYLVLLTFVFATACSDSHNDVDAGGGEGGVAVSPDTRESAEAAADIVLANPTPDDAAVPSDAPMPTDTATSTDATEADASAIRVNDLSLLPGGTFELWATGVSDHPKSLAAAEYTAIEPTAIVRVTFSADGATASVESIGTGYKGLVVNGAGQRTSSGSSWVYELNTAPAGSTLRVSAASATVMAELAINGSGVPVVVAWRGELRAGAGEILWPTARFHLVEPSTGATPAGIILRVREGEADGGASETTVMWPAAGAAISFQSLGSPPVPVIGIAIKGPESASQSATLELRAFDTPSASDLGKYSSYTDAQGNRCAIGRSALVIELPRTWASDGVVTGNRASTVVRGSFSGECVLPDGGVRLLNGSFELPATSDVILLTG